MEIKNYYQNVQSNGENRRSHHFSVADTAAMIAHEVITKGRSDGWAGDTEDLKNVATVLKQFNIHYTDDFKGTWQYKILRTGCDDTCPVFVKSIGG